MVGPGGSIYIQVPELLLWLKVSKIYVTGSKSELPDRIPDGIRLNVCVGHQLTFIEQSETFERDATLWNELKFNPSTTVN